MGISVKKTIFISQILYKLMLLVYVNCSCTHVDLTCECSTPVVFCFFFQIKNLQMCIVYMTVIILVYYNVIVLSVLGRIRFPAQNLVSLTSFS